MVFWAGGGRGRPGGPPRVPMPAWGSLPQPVAPHHIPAATRTSAPGLVLPGPPGRRYRLQVTLEVEPAEAQGSGPLSWDPSEWQHLPGTLVPRKTHLKREVTRPQGGTSMSRRSPPGPKDGQITYISAGRYTRRRSRRRRHGQPPVPTDTSSGSDPLPGALVGPAHG